MVILKEEGAIAHKTGREEVAKLGGSEYLKKCGNIISGYTGMMLTVDC
ncbi:hypothetical protein QUB75_02700 [Microcoleus sp. K1-B6]